MKAINRMTKDTPRYRLLRVRAFSEGVELKEIAVRTGYAYQYVSNLLRGVNKSETGLNNIERVLDEIANERSKRAA